MRIETSLEPEKTPVEPNLRCPVCRSASRVVVERDGMFLRRCAACRHLFSWVPKKKREAYDDLYYRESHRNWFAHPNEGLFRRILAILTELFPAGPLRLLDVGCGKGDFLKFVLKNSPVFELYGVDLFPNKHPGIRFIQGDFLQEDLGKESFDAVCCLAVIEHVDDPVAFLGGIHRLLRPGGLVCLTTVDSGGLIFRTAEWFDGIGVHAAFNRLYFTHHFQHCTRDSLRILLERSGFELCKQFRHGYPAKAIDTPRGNRLAEAAYRFFARLVFAAAALVGREMLQTVVARKHRGGALPASPPIASLP